MECWPAPNPPQRIFSHEVIINNEIPYHGHPLTTDCPKQNVVTTIRHVRPSGCMADCNRPAHCTRLFPLHLSADGLIRISGWCSLQFNGPSLQ